MHALSKHISYSGVSVKLFVAEAIVVNNGLKLDGVLGMAWPINETHDMSAVFQQMIDEKLIDVPVFGFYLNR